MKLIVLLFVVCLSFNNVLGKMHKRNRNKTLSPTSNSPTSNPTDTPTQYFLTPKQFPLLSTLTPRNSVYNLDIILITEYLSNKTIHPEIVNTITKAQSKLESIIISDITSSYNYSSLRPCYNDPLLKLSNNITSIDDLLIFVLITNQTSVASGGPCFMSTDKFPRVGLVMFNLQLFEDLTSKTRDPTSMKFMHDVLIHEFLHVTGIGTLWHHLLLPLRPLQPVKYNGTKGVENFHGYLRGTGDLLIETDFDNMGDHFDECAYNDEIMTPIASDVNYLSTMSCSALMDLNYKINMSMCDTKWQLPKKVPCDRNGYRLANQPGRLNLTGDVLHLPLEV